MTVTVTCDWCGEPKEMYPSHAERNDHHFCDKKCYGKWESSHMVGKDHPRYDRVEVACSWCGSPEKIKRSRAEHKDEHYCNYEHMAKDYRSRLTGEDNPSWDGGRATDYGPMWPPMRWKARERDDGKCRACGDGKEELGQYPDVHHIVPVADFVNVEDAHNLSNLVSLCRSCHSHYEGMDPAEQRENFNPVEGDVGDETPTPHGVETPLQME